MPCSEYEVLVARDYLKYLSSISETIAAIEDDITRLRSRLTGKAQSFSGMPGAPSIEPDTIALGVAKLEELVERWSNECVILANEWAYFAELAKSDPEMQMAWDHYVNRRRWDDVAKRYHYETRSARRLGNKGLVKFYEHVPEEYRRTFAPNAEDWEDDRIRPL